MSTDESKRIHEQESFRRGEQFLEDGDLKNLYLSDLAILISSEYSLLNPELRHQVQKMAHVAVYLDRPPDHLSESGKRIAREFLKHADHWTGQLAEEVKSEMKRRLANELPSWN